MAKCNHRYRCGGSVLGIDLEAKVSDATGLRPKKGKPNPSRGSKPGELRGNAGKGRPKGAKNVVTKAIKDAAIGALNAGDGAQAFFEERKENSPDAFMGFLKGIVPLDVTVGDPEGNPLVINILPVKPHD
jgi:hypothetical protein